jgi:anti-sigma factor RsiW
MTVEPRDHPGDLLSAHLDGELTPDEAATVEAHLAACDECRSDLAGLRAARSALRASPRLTAPPDFARELVLARHRASRWGVAVALVAASVVVVCGLALAPRNPDTSDDHPSLALASDAARFQSELGPATTPMSTAGVSPGLPWVDPRAPSSGADDGGDGRRDDGADDQSLADRVGDAVGALLDAIGG